MANRFLNNIKINDAYTLPASDGSSGQVITTDGSGNLSFVDPTSGAATTALSLNVTVKNVSGGSLAKGTIVHAHPSATPPSGNTIEVVAADYDDTAYMPAIGVLNETLANEAEGDAIMFGAVSGIDTSGFSIGDELWVGNNGAFTNTKPATAGQLIQKIAVVIKSHATAGLIKVFGAGRTNDVPLPLYIDNTNQRVGIGTASPQTKLHVTDAITISDVGGTNNVTLIQFTESNNYDQFAIKGDFAGAGGENKLKFTTDLGGGDILTLKGDGNVGIGTTSPSSGHKLDVAGAATFDYNINVNAVDTGNPSASTDQIRVSGYGIIGNRGTFYVTNGGGDVQIGNGSIHNQNPAASFGSGSIILYRGTSVTGNLTTSGSLKAQSTNYIDVSADQTDSAMVKIGVSSGSLEGFLMTDNTGANHISGNAVLKMLVYSTGGALIEPARFTTDGIVANGSDPAQNAEITSYGNMSFGHPGSGANTNGRFISIEGNADSSGEGSGRIFFTEHNSTTASMDNYGMSIGYRGGGTTINGASGNDWTGLSAIGNGQWGMWGHNNDATGALIMYGDRAATFVDFAGNTVQGISNLNVTGTITLTGADSENAFTISGASPTIAFTDTTSSADDFYIHVNSNNFYILSDRGAVGDYGVWDSPHPLQLEADTNIGYLFGNRIFDAAYHPSADYADDSDKWDGYQFADYLNQGVRTTDSPTFANPSVTDLYVADQIIHTGDTNTYTQFHAADQWRVVTGGAERLEVNNTQTTIAQPLVVNGSYAVTHDKIRSIDGENYFNINDDTTVQELFDQLGNPSTGGTGNISKVDDNTAPSTGCFQITGDLYWDVSGDYIKVDPNSGYTWEMWVKFVSGTDTDSRIYLGWGMYNASKTYFGNVQRYWGCSGTQFDSNSNNSGWYKIQGTIAGVGGNTGQFISGTEYVKPVLLLNYGSGGNVIRICGLRLYKSRKRATELQLFRKDSISVNTAANNDIVHTNKLNMINAGDDSLRVETPSGYIDLGPKNTSYCHIYTDRSAFYTNKEVYVNNQKVLHTGNEGSGNGIDSDTLDGLHASDFLRSEASDSYNTGNGSRTLTFLVEDGARIPSSGSETRFPLQIKSSSSSTDAAIAFHVSGDYAAYFGLDAATNDLAWGGWSAGSTTKYKIWHAGNDGPGSGLNADLLDGYSEASFFRSDLGQIGNNDLAFGATTGFPNQPRSGAYTVDHVGYSSTLAVFNSAGSANTAALQFHYDGSMYVHVNIDGTQWQSDKVWTAQNDGSGSGLDADLWDGNQFSSYLNQAVLTTSSPTFANMYVDGYIYHSGDTNTYIRMIAADDMQLVCGGRQMIRMDEGTDPDKLRFTEDNSWTNSSGNWRLHNSVGIKTDPDATASTGGVLKVLGATNGVPGLRVDSAAYSSAAQFYFGYNGSGIGVNNTAGYNSAGISFRYGTTFVGSININSTSTSYNTSSDYRLKENLTPITDGIQRVKLLQPKRFNFIGEDIIVDGFVAHETQEVVPEAVTGEKDAVDNEGNPEYQGIDQAKLVPLLTAALQEAIAKIENLEARIQLLENA